MQRSPSVCRGCSATFSTTSSLNRHYAHAPRCQARLREVVRARRDRRASTPPPPIDNPPSPTSEQPVVGTASATSRPRVWVEEIPDEGETRQPHIQMHPTAGRPLPGIFRTRWEEQREIDCLNGEPPWSPWADIEEWEHAQLLWRSKMSLEEIDEHLKMPIVSPGLRLFQPCLTSWAD